MIRRKKPNRNNYHWEYNLKCPSCGSGAVLKVEDKESSCNDASCQLKEFTKNKPIAELTNAICEDKIYSCSEQWVSRNTIQQSFRCKSCGYRFTEVRRVL